MTDQLPASPGERVARLNKTDFYDWFKMNLPSRAHAIMLADAMWPWIEQRIDAAIREAVLAEARWWNVGRSQEDYDERIAALEGQK
jgi:hypothetical protein